jgi:anti-anti-sigma factor
MTINKTAEGSKVTFELGGHLGLSDAERLENEVKPVLNKATELIFDMHGATYICSVALRVLLTAQKKMNSRGRMRVIRVPKPIMDIIETKGFTDIFYLEEADADAAEA